MAGIIGRPCAGYFRICGVTAVTHAEDAGTEGGLPAWPPREAGLTGNRDTTRPLRTLPGPTKQAELDSEMVTG
jgi:hypothetical protein